MNKIITCLLYSTPLLVYAQDYSQQINSRQEAFEQIKSLIKNTKRTLDGSNTNWSKLQQHTTSLTERSKSLQTLFPSGSQSGSKAKKSIWTKPERFQQLLARMDQGFQELYQASKNQDVTLAEMGLDKAKSTCKSCHRSYRSRW